MSGRVHSLESFGTVDGPGVRFVVFLQGCPLRCVYCHNPDTWDFNSGKQVEASDIIKDYMRNINFYNTGGVTITGGEPLLQIDFLIELFEIFKKKDVHTCIDTSGIVFNPNNPKWLAKLDYLLELTDLILLDIKHIDSSKHQELTSSPNENILAFAEYLSEKHVNIWIRHVVVPSITDDDNDLFKLGYFIGGLASVRALDVLPYHEMGIVKYAQMGLVYKLKNIPSMDKSTLIAKKQIIISGIKKRRQQNI